MPHIVKSSLDIGGIIIPWNQNEMNKMIEEKNKFFKEQEEQKKEEPKMDNKEHKEHKKHKDEFFKKSKKNQKVGEK